MAVDIPQAARNALRLAVCCAVLPLVICSGYFALGLWSYERELGERLAGLLPFSLLGCVLGLLGLARYGWLAIRQHAVPRSRAVRSTLGASGLLILMLPCHVGLIFAAIELQSHFDVIVRNELPEPLDSVRIYGSGGSYVALGSVVPGASVRSTFPSGMILGTWTMEALRGKTVYSANLDRSFEWYQLRDVLVTVEEDGTVSVALK